MSQSPLDNLIRSLSRLPGLGPRSARRIALHLLSDRNNTMQPLITSLSQAAEKIQNCTRCGNLDTTAPCHICQSAKRSDGQICVVAGVADLWAIERTGIYQGRYHILGGVLSALDGIGPSDLRINSLLQRLEEEPVEELILALSATVDGQATAHYITDRLPDRGAIKITRLAHGVPVGGQLDYLDDGTIVTALKSRATV